MSRLCYYISKTFTFLTVQILAASAVSEQGGTAGHAEGLAEGLTKGEQSGKEEKIKELIQKKILKGKTTAEIAEALEEEETEILRLIEEMQNPDF